MTLYRNTGQSASSAGAALSSTTDALPDLPTLNVPGTGGAITIEADGTAPGTKAIQVTPASATLGYWGFTGLASGTNQFAMRFLWKSPSVIPTVAFQPFISIRSSGGGTPIATLAIDTTTGKFQAIADIAATSTKSTNGMTVSTWYDIQIQIENPTISTGAMVVTVRNLAGTIDTNLSVAHGGALGAGTANFGTATMAHVRMGKVAATGDLGATRYKYVAVQTGATTALPTPGANTAPVVPAITPKIQSGATTTTFTSAATDPEGDTLTHLWTVVNQAGTTVTGLTGATTTTVTIPNQTTAGTCYVTYTANDGVATTSTTTYLFVAKGSGVAARPDYLVANLDSYTFGGTATSIVDGLRGTDTAKWIITGDNPAGDGVTVHMEVPASGHYDVDFYFDWVDTDGVTEVAGVVGPVTGQVFQGAAPITAAKIFNQPTAGWFHAQFSFSTSEDTALSSDLKDIRIRLTASQT